MQATGNKRFWLTIFLILGISAMFWGGSRYPELDDKATMAGSVRLEDPLSFQSVYQIQAGDPVYTKIAYSTVNWINTNKKGMTFGILLAAAIVTLLGYLRKRSFKNPLANTLLGFVVGTPLGVCVNCAAPIARGMHSAGTRLETTLATMFSSPTMNIVVLTILFTVFPMYLAVIKVVATLVLIFLFVPMIAQFYNPPDGEADNDKPLACSLDLNQSAANEKWSVAVFGASRDYLANLWFILKITGPLMLLAGFLGAAVSNLVPLDSFASADYSHAGLLAIVVLGTFLPVPITFDLMLTFTLLSAGMPASYVMALLFTLGTYSIYPFMLIWRGISKAVAVKLYAAVVLLGLVSGLVADWYDREQMQEMMDIFIEDANAAEARKYPGNIEITSLPFNVSQAPHSDRFTRYEGRDIGLHRDIDFSITDLWPPFFYGRGVASGDFHNDGWDDIAVATSTGVRLYRNDRGKTFQAVEPGLTSLQELNVFQVALVDINNDGWLDVFITTYKKGNYYLLNHNGSFGQSVLNKAAASPEILTLGLSFADVDHDSDLDAMLGNWNYGWPREIPTSQSRNSLLLNNGSTFDSVSLREIIGGTFSVLFTDMNMDRHPDLVVANDFGPPDMFYLGDGKGGFDPVSRGQGYVPVTSRGSMSIDTADIDNDLDLDLYIAQIAGRPDRQAGQLPSRNITQYCDDLRQTDERNKCQRNVAIREFYKFGMQSPADIKHCKTLPDKADVRECMAMMVMKTAVVKQKQELCEQIPAEYIKVRSLCTDAFVPGVQVSDERMKKAIPQKWNENVLLVSGDGRYTENAKKMGVNVTGWTWNSRFADLDNDEWQDLYVANGILRRHMVPNNLFFHNEQGKKFTPATDAYGLGNYMSIPSFSYLDFDRDGDLDIAMNTVNGPLFFYRNNTRNNESIVFEIRDFSGNHFGVGTRVVVNYGDGRHQVRELKSGGGYVSFDAPLLHFGLGNHGEVDDIQITWSTGETSDLAGPFPAGRVYRVVRRKQAGPGTGFTNGN